MCVKRIDAVAVADDDIIAVAVVASATGIFLVIMGAKFCAVHQNGAGCGSTGSRAVDAAVADINAAVIILLIVQGTPAEITADMIMSRCRRPRPTAF